MAKNLKWSKGKVQMEREPPSTCIFTSEMLCIFHVDITSKARGPISHSYILFKVSCGMWYVRKGIQMLALFHRSWCSHQGRGWPTLLQFTSHLLLLPQKPVCLNCLCSTISCNYHKQIKIKLKRHSVIICVKIMLSDNQHK